MRKLWILFSIDFRSLMAALSFGTTRRKRIGGAAMLVLITAFCFLISGYYCAIGGMLLNAIGGIEYMVPLAAGVACFISFFFTLFCASSAVFGGRDVDLILSLPIHAFYVMMAKMLALYFQNLFFCSLFLIPAAGVQVYYKGDSEYWYWLMVILVLFFVAFWPAFFSVLLGYGVAYLSGRMRHKALVTNLLYLGLFVTVFAGSFFLQSHLSHLMITEQMLNVAFKKWMYPLDLIRLALAGDGKALVSFALISLLPFLISGYFFSKHYQKMYSALSAHSVRGHYHLGQIEASSVLQALLQKEIRRYFGCAAYVFNTLTGAILLVIGSVAALLFQSDVQIVMAQMEIGDEAVRLLLIITLFILSITCTTNVSISMEGKNIWILQEAPLSAAMIFKAKIALQLLVVWPAFLMAGICAALAFQLGILDTVLFLVLGCFYSLSNALCGLVINLLLPKMNCENDTMIVKQSASVMVSSLGGMLIAAGIGAIVWTTRPWLSFLEQALILIFGLVAVSLSCVYWLQLCGQKRLQQL